MEYLPEFFDNYKLERSVKSNVISEVYRAVKVMVETGLPISNIITDDYLVDICLGDISINYEDFLSELQYLLKHVKINPTIVDSLVDYIIEFRINSSDFNKNDLEFLLAILHQIRVKHGMEFINGINEIFQCLIKQNLFLIHTDWKHLINHSLLPYFLNPYNEGHLKQLLDLNRLDVICALHEYFISTNVCISGLWPQIQSALRQPHSRKNALFLLKRRLQLSDAVDDESLFQSRSSTQYNNLIQLLEVSDAKQLHLLQPSMYLLHQLNELHLSWQITICVVYLTHPHSAIVEETLHSLLEESWWLQDNETFELIIPFVLGGINTARAKSNIKCGPLFKRFGEQQMIITSKHCDNIAWRPASFYYFHKELLPYITLDSISILSLLNRLQAVPNKNVRDTFMELYLKPKILQYITCDKNCGRAMKEVFYAVFLYYYYGYNRHCLCLKYPSIVAESLSQSYNIQSLYEVTTVTYSYLQFLMYLQIDRKNPKEFMILSHKYILETVGEEVVGQFGFETLHQTMIITKASFKNSKELAASLEITLLDDTINFENRSVALQIYSSLAVSLDVPLLDDTMSFENRFVAPQIYFPLTAYWHESKYETIMQLWTEMLLSGDYKFDVNTCRAFLKLHKLLFERTDICDTILSTQTDSVVITFFDCLAGDVNDSILERCFKKLMGMKKGSIFRRACNTLFEKLLLRCFTISWEIESFRVLFQESSHVRYLVTELWPIFTAEYCSCKKMLKLIFDDCLIAKPVHSKKEKVNFNIMMELIEDVHTHEDEFDKLDEFHLCQWNCYESQVTIWNAMIICCKFNCSHVWDICKIHLDKIFQKRYYAHSQIHAEKTRIYQLLLMVFQKYSKVVDDCSRYPVIFKYLCEESNQNDVKQLQMLLLTNVNFYPTLYDLLVTNSEALETRGTNVHTSVITILYHIVRYYGSRTQCSDVISALIIYTMGANFKVRLVSQMSILFLLRHAKKQQWTDIVNKYVVLENSLEFMLKEINWSSDLQYLAIFNPIENYTVESVFLDIPRLNNACGEELRLKSQILEDLSDEILFYGMKMYNTNREYSNLSTLEVKEDEIFDIKSAPSDIQVNSMVQRKPQNDIIESHEEDRSVPIQSGLIVIGSLVDSVANLGGLARTCHILGAATLVIPDIHATEAVEFQSLSMSAERWLDIKEVKIKKIGDYLKEMRNEGYAIIGAEQTNQSVLLRDHPFQYKTVLLIGNERTGIPADILTLLDTCVEIPQYGVVRSLNVHVAAALIVYEYSQKIKTIKLKRKKCAV